MDWDIKNKVLDSLDETVNSNAFLIELGIPKGELDLKKVIIQHLRAGTFHYELVKQDIYRGWNHYSEMVFPKQGDLICVIPKPGNTWNGIEDIQYEKISRDFLSELLKDMLTGGGVYFSVGSHGKLMSEKDSRNLIGEIINSLDNEYENWEPFKLETNFLYQVEDYYSSGYIKLGYFESCGRDLALAFKMKDTIYVLLTNGYG